MGGALYSLVRLTCNTLYPAYSSFKAVKSKNVRDYVKWMMYWIVFAFFTALETLVDPFLFWLPFYSELKIAVLLYLVSPVTRGSGVVYRRFLHPLLCYREEEIDAVLTRTREQGYQTVSTYTARGVSWVASSLLTTAIRGGGTVLQQIKRSYSMLEISDMAELAFRDDSRFQDVTDEMNKEERLASSARLKRRHVNRKDDLQNRHSMDLSSMFGSTESLSSGYCSDSFLPVNAETMDTQDYELWERGKQVRGTPKSARRLQMELVSDEEDYHYESITTPFGPLKRSLASGAVSPDICSSYYPSDRESDDEQEPHSRAQRVRTLSERSAIPGERSAMPGEGHAYNKKRYISESQMEAKNMRQSPETADLSHKSADFAGRPELTMEDLQLAARRLNLHLVIKEEDEDEDSKKPLPPKRSAKSGYLG